MITDEQLEALDLSARAATPGDWAMGKGYEQSDPGYYVYSLASGLVTVSEDTLSFADATFIANASPETVLALVAEVRRLRRFVR